MKKSYRTFTVLVLIFLISCSEDFLEEKPPHLITAETLYTSLEGFEAGLNALYAMVREEREGRTSVNNMIADMFMNGTDNLVTNHRSGFSNLYERWGSYNNSQYSETTGIFTWLYRIVNAANTIITRAESQGDGIDWSDVDKNRILAEAKALRAWAYRHLVFMWGDVPLNLSESQGSTIRTDWVRSPAREVKELIIADLLFAQEHIPVEGSLPGRLTKGAVQHYLAEMYLALSGEYPPPTEDVEDALYWTNQVVNNPAYRLITERYGVKVADPGVPYMDMFYDGNSNREEGNTEALWVFQYEQNVVGGGYSIWRRHHGSRYYLINIDGVTPLQVTYERGGRGSSRMSLTKWAIESYEPQDDRVSPYAMRKYFILKDAVGNAPYPADNLPPGYLYGDTIWLEWNHDISSDKKARLNWPYMRKMEGADPNNVIEHRQWNDQVYLRLADTYLLKAEALYLLGQTSAAAETINLIRRRSNASEISAAEVSLDFILDERSRELVLEEHRRHTLLRTGQWIERTRSYNHNGGQLITERDKLFPIPQVVIDANLTQKMTQNPGY